MTKTIADLFLIQSINLARENIRYVKVGDRKEIKESRIRLLNYPQFLLICLAAL
jgi:hypothetical protein